MAVRLFVGNLAYDVTEAELREHFAAVGQLSYISLATDRDTGKPRGFAFIEFSARADAEEAIRRLNNQAFKGRQLVINEARARDDRATAGPPRTARLARRLRLKRAPPPARTSVQTQPPGAGANRRRGRCNPNAGRGDPCASAPPDPCASVPKKRTLTMMMEAATTL